jgi:plasmid stability protein
MSTLTISLPGDTARRLKARAASRGISLDKLMEEMSAAALTAHDAETRFKAMAAKNSRDAALNVLARLDRDQQARQR